MKLAFCLYKYFPYGGLQRNMLTIARACLAKGHQVQVWCHLWEAPYEEGVDVCELPVTGFTNSGRMKSFARSVIAKAAEEPVDLVVGFNKIPGLDIYYAADTCFAYKALYERDGLYRLLPRTRNYMKLEEAVFGAQKTVEILEVSRVERANFIRCYGTDPQRFHTLPPGIARNRVMPANYLDVRQKARQAFGFSDKTTVFIAVGSGFRTKGLDRSIKALAALNSHLPEAQLLIVGNDKQERFEQLAEDLGIKAQVHFLGGRDDVPELMQAADVLIHPAYKENTGNVLLEAAVAGLPVVTTDVCGYAHYITDHQLGRVVHSPFEAESLDTALQQVLATDREVWRQNGTKFAAEQDIFSRPERAAEIIENIGARRG